MKKRISIVLSIALGLTFYACNDGGGGVTPKDTQSPDFTSATMASVEENQLFAITLSATDMSSITYSIDEDDALLFDVNETSGVVTFKIAPNYEDNHNGDNTYSFTAMAKDISENNSTQSVTITILDVFPEIIIHNEFEYKEVLSPYTTKIWLDRNVGASQICTAFNDTACYGDYYQWGRATDGHEKTTSSTTDIQAGTIIAADSRFIITNSDWTTEDSDGGLRTVEWSKIDGSSICPKGYRVPTSAELESETIYASTPVTSSLDAYQNFLKLPSAGIREFNGGLLQYQGDIGRIWESDVHNLESNILGYASGGAGGGSASHAYGFSVRCLKD